MSDRKHWSIREAAKYLGMSEAFMRKAVHSRSIPFCRIGSKSLRFRQEDLDRWVEANSSGGEVNYVQRGR